MLRASGTAYLLRIRFHSRNDPTVTAMKDQNEEKLAVPCGNRIRLLRESLGMNQEEVGEFLDCSDESISKIERGIHMMKIWRMIRLCQACGVSMDYLVRGINTDDKDAVPTFIIEAFQKADPLELQILRAHMKNAQDEIARWQDMKTQFRNLYGHPQGNPNSPKKE